MLAIEKSWDGETVEIAEPVVADEELAALKEQMEALFRDSMSAGAAA